MKKILTILVFLTFLASLSYAQQVDHTSDAAAIAKELANPNATLGTMNFPVDYIHFQGDMPAADQQNAFKISFQPILPYPVKPGVNIFLRPLIPVIVVQPVFSKSEGFESKAGLGDISFDLAVGKTWKSKWVTFLGGEASLPTGTGSLSSGRYSLGPEIYLGKKLKGGFLGLLLYNTWTVDKNDAQGNEIITGGQYFYTIFLKNAWQIQAQPTWTYNHHANGTKWTLPVGTGVSKTCKFNRTSVKYALQYWYYAASADPIGPQHQVRLQVSPVVPLPWGGTNKK